MPTPRIAAVHDLSCYGRCSLTIALPVLSAMGCQCCPLPTALLSAHTGFTGGSFLDLTDEMTRITEHWEQIGLRFDGIYSGFLGSAAQIDVVERVIRRGSGAAAWVIVDPVLGDHGKAYRTCTPELCRGMRQLAEQADVITPNLTEAAILLERPYEEIQACDAAAVVQKLSRDGRRSVVLTGYSAAEGQTGALCFDHLSGQVPGGADIPGTAGFLRYRRPVCQCPHRWAGRRDPAVSGGASCGGICSGLCEPHAEGGADRNGRRGL